MEKQKFCKNCGRPLPMGDTCCGYCGAPVSRSHGKLIMAAVLGLLLIFVLGAAALKLMTPEPADPIDPLNAPEEAQEILEYALPSRQGMIRRLQNLGYDEETARAAADGCGADWTELAKQALEEYLASPYGGYSPDGLREQLEMEEFTETEIRQAMESLGDVDWQAQSDQCAESYLSAIPMSRPELLQQLIYEGFTPEQAASTADRCSADWKENALACIADEPFYIDDEELARILKNNGFTPEEIAYALENR